MRYVILALAFFAVGAAGMFGAWGDSLPADTWAALGDGMGALVALAWVAQTAVRGLLASASIRREERAAIARREELRARWQESFKRQPLP